MKLVSKNHILLIHEEGSESALLERTLLGCYPAPTLTVLPGGADLPAWLEANERPNLILLALPGDGGLSVLPILKTDQRYQSIPVLVLSESAHQPAVLEAYNQGANGYLQKPVLEADLVVRLQLTYKYWFGVGKTPRGG